MRRVLLLLVLPATATLSVLAASASVVDVNDGDEVLIEDFASPYHTWEVMNDPVMGGKSTSNFVNENGIAKFTGVCAIVPFLHAPGFIKLQTQSTSTGDDAFPDISSCTALQVIMKTNVPYDGYRIGFGTKRSGGHGRGYKAPSLTVPLSKFDKVTIPLDQFSLHWDDATGDIITTCSDDDSYCPDVDTLRDMKALSFWGEGVEGDVSLEVKRISAVGCKADASYESELEDAEDQAESGSAYLTEAEEETSEVAMEEHGEKAHGEKAHANHGHGDSHNNIPKENNAGTARWTLHTAKWGTLTTVSGSVLTDGKHDSKNPDTSQPLFASVVPYATDEDNGRIFFYMMGSHHLHKSTLTVSQASINPMLYAVGGCGTSTSSVVDVQDPRCAKISVSGAIHPCGTHSVGEHCDAVGSEALFAAHPTMKDWPEDHDFIVHELVPLDDGFWMLANFGGGATITPELYSSCEKDAIEPHSIQGGSAVVATSFLGNGYPVNMPAWSATAKRARWLVHNSLWATISTLNENGDGTFGNIRAITDGATTELSTGLPVFNLPDVDPVYDHCTDLYRSGCSQPCYI